MDYQNCDMIFYAEMHTDAYKQALFSDTHKQPLQTDAYKQTLYTDTQTNIAGVLRRHHRGTFRQSHGTKVFLVIKSSTQAFPPFCCIYL